MPTPLGRLLARAWRRLWHGRGAAAAREDARAAVVRARFWSELRAGQREAEAASRGRPR